jgi:hypothetical protein
LTGLSTALAHLRAAVEALAEGVKRHNYASSPSRQATNPKMNHPAKKW